MAKKFDVYIYRNEEEDLDPIYPPNAGYALKEYLADDPKDRQEPGYSIQIRDGQSLICVDLTTKQLKAMLREAEKLKSVDMRSTDGGISGVYADSPST